MLFSCMVTVVRFARGSAGGTFSWARCFVLFPLGRVLVLPTENPLTMRGWITNRWTRGSTARFPTNLSDSQLPLALARVNSDVIPLRFKTLTRQRSVVIELGGTSNRVSPARLGWFWSCQVESYLRTPRALVMRGKPATMQGGLTNRWTRAEPARLSATTCP